MSRPFLYTQQITDNFIVNFDFPIFLYKLL